jgi:hypothetical protein
MSSGRFDLNDYVTVDERIDQFWAEHPYGRILTDVAWVAPDGSSVAVLASVYATREDDKPAATGLAQEERGGGRGPVNSSSWWENCETSAIGRALANLGMSLSKHRPSREEMQKAGRYEQQTTPRAGTTPGREPAPCNAPQRPVPSDRPAAVPSAAGPPSPDNGKRVPTFAEARQYALDETISAKGRLRAATIALELAGSLDELADTYSKVMALPERAGLKDTYEARHKALKELEAVPL